MASNAMNQRLPMADLTGQSGARVRSLKTGTKRLVSPSALKSLFMKGGHVIDAKMNFIILLRNVNSNI
jgi:hypothetical protein